MRLLDGDGGTAENGAVECGGGGVPPPYCSKAPLEPYWGLPGIHEALVKGWRWPDNVGGVSARMIRMLPPAGRRLPRCSRARLAQPSRAQLLADPGTSLAIAPSGPLASANRRVAGSQAFAGRSEAAAAAVGSKLAPWGRQGPRWRATSSRCRVSATRRHGGACTALPAPAVWCDPADRVQHAALQRARAPGRQTGCATTSPCLHPPRAPIPRPHPPPSDPADVEMEVRRPAGAWGSARATAGGAGGGGWRRQRRHARSPACPPCPATHPRRRSL